MRQPATTAVRSFSLSAARLLGLALLCVSTSMVVNRSSAQEGGNEGVYDMMVAVFAGGGGTSQGGEYELSGTIGQFLAKPADGDEFDVSCGLWSGFGPDCREGDFDCDGFVNSADLSVLLAHWGWCPDCPADIDGDGEVSSPDLSILLANWG